MPISFAQTTGLHNTLHTFTTCTALVKHNGNVSISFEHPTVMQLHNGELLVSATRPTIVTTPHCLVTIKPNTIALITVTNKVTKVRNLWELGHAAIRQTVNGDYVDIAAGEESILGFDEKSVVKSLEKDSMGRRKVRGIDVPGGMYMHRAEIPLVLLMQAENSAFLNDLVASDNQADKAIAGKLIKMAAVMQQVTASHGQFAPVAPDPTLKY